MNLKESKYRTILSGRVVPFKIDIDSNLNFIIPLYENMPEEISEE